MRISSVEAFPITLTLADPIPMSSGVIASTGNVVVKVTTTDGLVGWGEGVEAPALTGHSQAGIVEDVEALTGVVKGSDPMRRVELWLRMSRACPAASTAIAAIDIAVHDLVGKALCLPVHTLIGGAIRDRVPALTLVGSGHPAADAAKLAGRHEQGFRWFKIKLGMGDPEKERTTIRRALDLVGDEGVVCGDANEAWDEEQALDFLERLEGWGVRFIEQPVPRGGDRLLRVAEKSPVPLCADEGAGSLDDVAGLIGTAIGGVSLKLIKHGGITGVMRGSAICSVGGLQVNLAGKVIESSISAAANLHCAAAMDSVDYGCSPANAGVTLDVTEDPIRLEGGEFPVSNRPGLGVEVDERLLRKLA